MKAIKDTKSIKNYNISLILNYFKTHKAGTKTDVAKATLLSITTCNTILNELTKSNQLKVSSSLKTGNGRPSRIYSLNCDFKYSLCIMLVNKDNKCQLTLLIVDLLGNPIKQKNKLFDDITKADIISVIKDEFNVYNNIHKIIIGIPATFDNSEAIEICDFSKLVKVQLKQELKNEFNVFVAVENDMNIIVSALFSEQATNSEGAYIAISFSEYKYPSCGIIVNKKLLKGYSNFAGEISVLPNVKFIENPYHNKDPKREVIKITSEIICMITSILNPKTVSLIDTSLKKEDVVDILKSCSIYIPKNHLPEILLYDDYDAYLIKGLCYLSINEDFI